MDYNYAELFFFIALSRYPKALYLLMENLLKEEEENLYKEKIILSR